MKTTSSEHVVYINCYECQIKNNLSSYYGLLDPRISAADKDLPVPHRKQPKNDPRK